MDAPLRLLLLAVAGLLFVIGGYSDTNTNELWGWAFLLCVLAMIVPDLLGGRRKWWRR